MATISLPYVQWRNGRPRFAPGPRERDLGFQSIDLKHPDGRWLDLVETKAWAETKQAEIAAARKGGRKKPAAVPGRSVADLLDDWHKALTVKAERGDEDALSPTTIEGYRKQIAAITFKPQPPADRKAGKPRAPEAFGATPVSAIGKVEVNAFIEYQIGVRGLHMARASRAVLQAAFSWAELSAKWRLPGNPASKLRFKKPEGRIVIYTDAEIRALIAAADALPCGPEDAYRRASVGDAVMLGLFTGQRQADRLALVDAGLSDGRRMFRQQKTGAIVAIREMPQLAARLAAAKARVAALKLKLGLKELPATIVVDETTGRPYVADTFRHVFDKVRLAAVPACPSIAGRRDQDLRDTAVTWLARAGATLPEISAITGHSLASIHAVMKHYLAITPELGDVAIEKLKVWMAAQGMTV